MEDLDFTQLKQVLSDIDTEIRLPFSERRPKCDFAETVAELNTREKNLKFIIGIARIIADSCEELTEKQSTYEEQINWQKLKIEEFANETYELEQELLDKNKIIVDLTQKIGANERVIKSLEKESVHKSQSLKHSFEDNEANELLEECLFQKSREFEGKLYSDMMKKKDVVIFKKKNKLKTMKDRMWDKENKIFFLENQVSMLNSKVKELKQCVKENKESKLEQEEVIEMLKNSNDTLTKSLKKLESQLYVFERANKVSDNCCSYKCFHKAEDKEEYIESLATLQSEFEEINHSGMSEIFDIHSMNDIHILPRNIQINIAEIFFKLVLFI